MIGIYVREKIFFFIDPGDKHNYFANEQTKVRQRKKKYAKWCAEVDREGMR